MKIMIKWGTCLLALLLAVMSFPVCALASPVADENKSDNLVVTYYSAKSIEEGNALAEKKWEQAQEKQLSEAEIEELKNRSIKSNTYYYNKVTSKTQSFMMPNGRYASITFSATIDYYQNSSGSNFIFNVRNYTSFASNSNTSIDVLSKSYSLIDSGRTMAAYFSLKVGVKPMIGSTWNYYNKSYYVEYHPNNQITIYG